MASDWPQAGPPGPAGAGLTSYTTSVPAVNSYTVSHNLNRVPVAITFYDVSGTECEVGVRIVDANSLDILQDNPSEGTVSIA